MKERIIGAIVLVAVVVLVVPVFLDGPPAEGEVVTERVPLPGQDADVPVTTQVLDLNRDYPVATQVTTATERVAEPVAQTPVPRPAAEPPSQEPAEQAPQPVTTSGSSTGMWAVQLGSFSNQENAEKLAADLRKQGFAAFLSQLTTANGQLHRVRIGPQKDREAAEAMAARLSTAGHSGQVVPHP